MLTIFIVGIHTALHCSPRPTSLCAYGVTFSFEGERVARRDAEDGKGRKTERGKKTSEKSKTTESSRLPVDSCLSSPLLPPLLRSSPTLRGLVRSFPPTGVQLPYHVTAAPTNQSCSQSAPMMDSMARMEHVSSATKSTAAGALTSFFVSSASDGHPISLRTRAPIASTSFYSYPISHRPLLYRCHVPSISINVPETYPTESLHPKAAINSGSQLQL